MRTYYLFIDNEFCIQNVFESLQIGLKQGIVYKQIKEHELLPSYIIMESIYKDEYLRDEINKELRERGYDKSFIILKPLVKERAII